MFPCWFSTISYKSVGRPGARLNVQRHDGVHKFNKMDSAWVEPDTMGFLDDVKKRQAAERADASPAASVLAQPSASQGVPEVVGCLSMLSTGLGAFARRLGAAMPDIRAAYEIRGHGQPQGWRQGGYKLVRTGEQSHRFEFSCTGAQPIEFSTTSREACDQILDELITAGLKVQYRSHADWKFLFNVTPVVPVEITFEPYDDDSAIRLSVKNLEDIGIRVERMEASRVDESFLHELEQCVLRKPNNFINLLGNQIGDDLREKFRTQIARRQLEREHQLDPTAAPAQDAGAMGRLKNFIGRLGPKKP